MEKPMICKGSDGPMRRRASLTASRVAAIQSSHSTPVNRARNGPVRWQPDRDRDKAMFAIAPRDMAQTIRRIGEPM